MPEEPTNLVLELLRRIDTKVDALRDDMLEVKQRLSLVEEGVAIVHRRFDRLEIRVDRIEKRLGLADAF